jgi:hypothetical protein
MGVWDLLSLSLGAEFGVLTRLEAETKSFGAQIPKVEFRRKHQETNIVIL